MNAGLAAGSAAIAAVVFWTIAADAAGRRRMTIGTLPALLPIAAGAAAAAAAVAGAQSAAIAACAGVAVAGWVDARTGSIFDPLTIAVAAGSLALCALDGALANATYGAAAVGAALLFLHGVTNGRGLGFGDVKLGAALGLALGAPTGLTAIGLAFVFGGGYGVWLLATKRAHAGSEVRFGPFITAGTFTALALPLGVLR